MASQTSKALPYVVLLSTLGIVSGEAYFDVEVDLETIIPILIPLGLGGAGLSAVRSIAQAKTAMMPAETRKVIVEELQKLKTAP